jgi:hypothetical protein
MLLEATILTHTYISIVSLRIIDYGELFIMCMLKMIVAIDKSRSKHWLQLANASAHRPTLVLYVMLHFRLLPLLYTTLGRGRVKRARRDNIGIICIAIGER